MLVEAGEIAGGEGNVGGGDGGLAGEGELLLVEMPVRDELHVAVHRVRARVAALQMQLRRHVHRF